MKATAAALKTYLSGFDLPAYNAESIPETTDPPYITYPMNLPEWSDKASLYIQIWDRSHSNTFILEKADEILADIGEGKLIVAEGTTLVIWPETPAVQLIVDGDIRSAYINLSINAYQMPGD